MSALLHERHLERHEIDELAELERLLSRGESLGDYVIHALDLTGFDGWGEAARTVPWTADVAERLAALR